MPEEKSDERVLALVVVAPGSTLEEATLIARVRERLAGFKCPKRIKVPR